ncbi:MAG TPA: hypothetical protein VGK30_07170 [Candidatus Binatia bacterium]|jgi:hypothetical protein
MAGKLRSLKPDLEPTGRTVTVRELVGGDPHESRLVEVRLGGREDRADFHSGYCRARRRGAFDQCGRRPARGAVVCGAHGGGHAVRQREGTRLSPQEAGRLSGLARQLKKNGRVDLAGFPALLPWLQERAQQLREQPALLDLREDVVRLTSLLDLILSGQLDIEIEETVRLVTALVQTKANALRTKQALEAPGMVHADRVKAMILKLVQLLQAYVPEERHAQVKRELILMGANPQAFTAVTTAGAD